MILITGGAGFIGANFVREWLAQSDEAVVNLDALTYAGHLQNLAPWVNDARHLFVQGDVTDAACVSACLAAHSPRAVIHFAAESHVDRSIAGAEAFVHTNIVGTHRLLEATRVYWQGLAPAARAAFRFVQISTDEVYGSLALDAPAFTEQHPFAPNNPYAASKAAADHLVRAWHHTYGLPVLTLHASNNYGPYQFPEKLIPLCLSRALAGQSLPLYGDGLQRRDWLYVTDHCSAVRRVLEAGAPGAVYNVGGRSERSNLALVQALCTLLDELRPRADGQSYATQIAFVPDRPGHDQRYAIDPSALERELGWRATQDFQTGLRRTVQWYLEHSDWVAQSLQRKYAA